MDTCVCCNGSSRRASPKSPSLHRYPLRSAFVAFSSTLAARRQAQHTSVARPCWLCCQPAPKKLASANASQATKEQGSRSPAKQVRGHQAIACHIRTWLQVAMQDARRVQVLHAYQTVTGSCPCLFISQAREEVRYYTSSMQAYKSVQRC